MSLSYQVISEEGKMLALPKWKNTNHEDNVALMDLMRRTQWINEREFDNVSSFAFHRKVFYNAWWNKATTKARGLFMNNKTGDIVSRSYDKFFNIGERKETNPHHIEKTLKFPLKVYMKENGYLGIVGYDEEKDEIFISSKSSKEGPFADHFEYMFNKHLDTKGIRAEVESYLKYGKCSFVFEVIDPVFDPHMIKYKEPGLVLLDIVNRNAIFEKLDYTDLLEAAHYFKLFYKIKTVIIPNFKSFEEWHCLVAKDMNNHTEGAVIEAADGFMFKVKYPYYAFWKYMRSCKDKIRSHRVKGKPKPQFQYGDNEGMEEFITWAFEQSDATLELDIIQLREMYANKG